jgi:hypothetical protein
LRALRRRSRSTSALVSAGMSPPLAIAAVRFSISRASRSRSLDFPSERVLANLALQVLVSRGVLPQPSTSDARPGRGDAEERKRELLAEGGRRDRRKLRARRREAAGSPFLSIRSARFLQDQTYNPPAVSLSPGARLGAYEVLGLIGTGGMGEVYRARDTKTSGAPNGGPTSRGPAHTQLSAHKSSPGSSVALSSCLFLWVGSRSILL